MAVHLVQLPPLHTMFVPHDIPSPRWPPLSAHSCVPLEHAVAPVWHGLVPAAVSGHAVPAAHVAQLPLLHTMLVPHFVPLATFAAVSVHTCLPEAHDVVPIWQGFCGAVSGHPAPLVHAPHVPPLQTMLVPHSAPSARFIVVSTHVCFPVAQDVVPAWQGFCGATSGQLVSLVHAPHAPPPHTLFMPHGAPLLMGLRASVHVATPPVHALTVPWLHGLVGVHAALTVHGLHLPA